MATLQRSSRLPPATYVQSLVEWRYAKAHRYWDDCGKLIAAIEAAFPGLRAEVLAADGFKFAGKQGLQASFYWDKASLTQAGGGPILAAAADEFWSLVSEGLGIDAPTRVGHRTWYIYELANQAEASAWLSSHLVWQFPDGLGEILGSPTSNGIVLRTRLDGQGNRRMRLEIAPGSAKILSTEGDATRDKDGILVDVDIAVERAVPTDFSDFVSANLHFIRDHIEQLFKNRAHRE